MAKNLTAGSRVRYNGDLPEDWDRNGIVVTVEADASGDQVVTVEFGVPGRVQDVLASDLDRDPLSAQHYDDDGNPFEGES